MKKKFMAVAVAVLTMVSVMSAHALESQIENTVTTCQQDNGQKKDKADRQGKKRDGRHMRHNMKHHPDFFSGIELTAEQKQALEAMRQERRTEREQARKEQQAKQEQMRQEDQKKMNEKIRSILTPEQYAQYEKNVEAVKAEHMKNKKDIKGGERPKPQMRRGDR